MGGKGVGRTRSGEPTLTIEGLMLALAEAGKARSVSSNTPVILRNSAGSMMCAGVMLESKADGTVVHGAVQCDRGQGDGGESQARGWRHQGGRTVSVLLCTLDPSLAQTGWAWVLLDGSKPLQKPRSAFGSTRTPSEAVEVLNAVHRAEGAAKFVVYIERSRAPFRRYASASAVATNCGQLLKESNPPRTVSLLFVEPALWMARTTNNLPGTTKERSRFYCERVLHETVEGLTDDACDARAFLEYARTDVILRGRKR